MRQRVISQTQRRSTLVGLLGYIPHTYALANNRPMVWLSSDPDPVEGVINPPPPPPLARGRNAPASGSGLASGCHAPAGESDLVGWPNQTPGSFRYAPLRDVRRDPDQMEITARRDVAPWQFSDVPPRLVPGLLTYAGVIKKWTKIAESKPFYTRPRPLRCLIHPDATCEQCHLCVERWFLVF